MNIVKIVTKFRPILRKKVFLYPFFNQNLSDLDGGESWCVDTYDSAISSTFYCVVRYSEDEIVFSISSTFRDYNWAIGVKQVSYRFCDPYLISGVRRHVWFHGLFAILYCAFLEFCIMMCGVFVIVPFVMWRYTVVVLVLLGLVFGFLSCASGMLFWNLVGG